MENEFLENYGCFNVIAKVEGRRHDSCLVFTAHYDHLGKLGKKTYYPGAHDNASGTAAIITLAAHYAKNTPEYDMYFIAFSGEDANLRGSEWYAEHPVVPLSQIKYLIWLFSDFAHFKSLIRHNVSPKFSTSLFHVCKICSIFISKQYFQFS